MKEIEAEVYFSARRRRVVRIEPKGADDLRDALNKSGIMGEFNMNGYKWVLKDGSDELGEGSCGHQPMETTRLTYRRENTGG